MKPYFAYIRVSTPKQGKGVSLEEQQAAIRAHAERVGIQIAEWFEEKETAAKTGRAVFSKMLARLEHGDAEGVIIHKIDRSARNLWDWAALSKLFDRGIDVQFAHDSIDLKSRGGRLSADIMAIVAADYIRNLREEVKKGFYGRLKQGLYPLPAPIGYMDRGQGQPKAIDPERAHFIRLAFERYATRTVGLKNLQRELKALGLRTRAGKPVPVTGLSTILNNPFYAGLIRIRRTGETFEGKHEPLIPMELFECVRTILRGKTVARSLKHDYVFRRIVQCAGCGLHLIGEVQKGHVYYRCHTEKCRGTSVREEALDGALQGELKLLIGDKREMGEIRDMVEDERRNADSHLTRARDALGALVAKCDERLGRLTDAVIDQLIDREAFEARKSALLLEKKTLQQRLTSASAADLPGRKAFAHLELANAAYSGYVFANSFEKRRIIDCLTSNLSVSGKNIGIALHSPYREIANWRKSQNGAPYCRTPRTRARKLLAKIEEVAPDASYDSIVSFLREIEDVVKRGSQLEHALPNTSPTSPISLLGSRPHSARRPLTSRDGRKAELPEERRRQAA